MKDSLINRSFRPRATVFLVLLVSSLGSAFAETPAKPTGGSSDAVTVEAHYALSYNGIKVGHVDVVSNVDGNAYKITGSASVSVLFGALKWSGSSGASGLIEKGEPVPASYNAEWHANKKATAVRIGFKDKVARDVAAEPPAKLKHDTVPVLPVHKVDALDPFSAMLRVTKTSNVGGPCDRQVPIFDGWQRFDIIMTMKRSAKLPADVKGGPPVSGYVCRIVYRPIAGHRDNADTKAYAANTDSEVVLRPIAGTRVLIPHSVTIPTAWGTGAMTMTHVEISGPSIGKIALSE